MFRLRLIGVIEPKSVTKFVDRDAVKIINRRCKVSAIRILGNRTIEDGIGFFEVPVPVAEQCYCQNSGAEIITENFVIEHDQHFIVTLGGRHGRVFYPGELKMSEVWIPGSKGVNG